MCAYYAKLKRLPAKTIDFIDFLERSLRRQPTADKKQPALADANLIVADDDAIGCLSVE
jgi:hypothetical protein